MVMLLRNIDQANELCNGTRLIVTILGKHFIEAETISGMNPDTKVFRQKMLLSPSDNTKFPVPSSEDNFLYQSVTR